MSPLGVLYTIADAAHMVWPPVAAVSDVVARRYRAAWPLNATEVAHAIPVMQASHSGLRDLPPPRLATIRRLAQRWGQPAVVDAKPGASGVIAADFVAKSAPDGHTVFFTLPLTHVNVPILQTKVPYDPVRDFAPLSMLATGGPMLVARANAPYGNVREFVEFARRQTKPLSYGTWGTGSTAHLFGELLKRQTGTQLLHVAYKAEAAVHNDLFGESLDFGWANPSTARGHTQAGKMKVLGIAGTRRVSAMPQVPTFGEQGFQGFDIDSWIGVYGPARLPEPIALAWKYDIAADRWSEIAPLPSARRWVCMVSAQSRSRQSSGWCCKVDHAACTSRSASARSPIWMSNFASVSWQVVRADSSSCGSAMCSRRRCRAASG